MNHATALATTFAQPPLISSRTSICHPRLTAALDPEVPATKGQGDESPQSVVCRMGLCPLASDDNDRREVRKVGWGGVGWGGGGGGGGGGSMPVARVSPERP
jgi:hypothetical protein